MPIPSESLQDYVNCVLLMLTIPPESLQDYENCANTYKYKLLKSLGSKPRPLTPRSKYRMLLKSMCIQGTTVGYWQLDSR